MKDEHDKTGHIFLSRPGLELKCHRCKASLPLLHPHIMVERYDRDDNIICETCYEHYRLKESEKLFSQNDKNT
ncbi:hypothetical protein [Desulfobulbus oligotrophicus]|jgi:hypothetical protein|uniref:Uncharacterized protein n=1 Tax=Desulfobulbus oligotrophicus TaxID=1909699 RepID=A0A7T6AR10_9BACT|nr:hypothetical protein [Desulfobulbus oligotrophicus]MDY0391316.1 hypothetical protein [Desulfobulbus oligotrophicus]QQG66097.1 hypothetical protein HP555_09555 [Desulfobulbus oligotrophicus]